MSRGNVEEEEEEEEEEEAAMSLVNFELNQCDATVGPTYLYLCTETQVDM